MCTHRASQALDRSTLSPTGELVIADTPEGVMRRNTMHNRVVADAFVPGGGRPMTINLANHKDFMVDEDTPSAKVVVEGANLFLTAEARRALFDTCGLPIVKDSSANKCGVICSSMEILASMALSDEEFLAIKDEYVPQVVDRLRFLARNEAKMLFAEAGRDPSTPLPQISEQISIAILRCKTAVGQTLDRFDEPNRYRLWPIIQEQLPSSICEQYGGRLQERVPWEYQKQMIASGLASRMVYREGLAFVRAMPDSRLPSFALAYLQQEQRVRQLAKDVASSGMDFSSEVEALLLKGGVRIAAEEAAIKAAIKN
jgi:glutamate dehydrogenase